MTAPKPKFEIPPQVKEILDAAQASNQRIVLMTCGLTGSGKSTLSHNITTRYPTYTRLSIDGLIFSSHGTYGIDYSPSQLATLQDEAETKLQQQLVGILREGERDVVLDLAFYEKSTREEYRGIVERVGEGRYKVVLVVFRLMTGGEDALWERIEGRRLVNEKGNGEEKGGWEGMSVERRVLEEYARAFEWPNGEGEIVVAVE